MTTWTPDSPPPCPCCGTRLVERTEPDGGEEGGMLYAYLCPVCRWEDAGSYDYQRLTVATAPWTRDLWAELVLTREERDSFLFQIHALCDARNRLAELVPLGQETGDVESNVAGYIADLLKERDAARCDLAQVEAERDRHAAYVRSLDAALDNTFTDRDTLAARVRELETEAQALRSDAEASRAREAGLMARIAELEAPGECQSVHKLRAALADLVEAVADEGPVTATVAPVWDRACAVLSAGWREGQEVTR